MIFSTGTVNGNYVVYNKTVSKEQFKTFLSDLKQQIASYSGYQQALNVFQKLKNAYPHQASDITHSENSYGNNIINSKDSIIAFEANNLENCRYLAYAKYGTTVMDGFAIYPETNKCYEVVAAGEGSHSCYFSYLPWQGNEIYYSLSGYPLKNGFGCVYARAFDYSILNKKFEPKPREDQVRKIVTHMQTTGER